MDGYENENIINERLEGRIKDLRGRDKEKEYNGEVRIDWRKGKKI